MLILPLEKNITGKQFFPLCVHTIAQIYLHFLIIAIILVLYPPQNRLLVVVIVGFNMTHEFVVNNFSARLSTKPLASCEFVDRVEFCFCSPRGCKFKTIAYS